VFAVKVHKFAQNMYPEEGVQNIFSSTRSFRFSPAYWCFLVITGAR